MPASFYKKHFLIKILPLFKAIAEPWYFLFLFSVLVGYKIIVIERVSFADDVPGIWLPVSWKSANNGKHSIDVTISRYYVIVHCFWRFFISVVNFNYWSRFHVNIINISVVMTTFFHEGLTRNPEIGKTHVWVLANVWRLELARDTKFRTYVSNKMLLKNENCQDYSFYSFWVIKVKSSKRGGGGKISVPLHQD